LFDKVSKRFSADEKQQLNVGAITIYAGITPPILRALDDYFRSDESGGVDAIIFWNPASPPHLPAFFLRERSSFKQLASYFQHDPVDDLYQTHNIHPLSIDEAVRSEIIVPN
jgi:hypothetical protein